MEIFRALGVIAETAGPETDPLAGPLGLDGLNPADHTDLFTLQLPPYASIYLGEEGMLGGEARDRIAGFWRVAGSAPPAEPDHLAVLLSAYTSLVEGEEAGREKAAWRRLRHAFFWEHLGSWLFPYLARSAEVAHPPYCRWSQILADALRDEADRLGPPARLPAHLRAVPPAVEEDGAALLGALLAPARSGIILTRRDLARAADATGLGLRLGERRYILENFFNQAPEVTASWLSREAERQADLFAALEFPSPMAQYWQGRARSTAELLTRATPAPTPTLQEVTHA